MIENFTITTERVADIPLLRAQMQQMDLPHLLETSFPTHGNWQGLSPRAVSKSESIGYNAPELQH